VVVAAVAVAVRPLAAAAGTAAGMLAAASLSARLPTSVVVAPVPWPQRRAVGAFTTQS
jgi:hypothetical protein